MTEPDAALASDSSSVRFGPPMVRGWQPVELVGRGGTAEVWRALSPRGDEAALKVLRPELCGQPGSAFLLRREHDCLGRVRGAAFVRALELADSPAGAALVLEYLPSGDLVPLLGGPVHQWLAAFAAVVRGVEALHALGLAHGDLKPRNVLFGRDGAPRIIDFTAAGPLTAPAPRATAAYRPACEFPPTAGDADRFALAALLFELVAGRLPFGPAGQTEPGAAPVTVVMADAHAEALLAIACLGLTRGGCLGLSPFRDVIESVLARQ